MILILLLALMGSAYGSVIPLQDSAAKYRLPDDIRPTHYDLELFFDPDNEANFRGNVVIRAIPNKSISQIILHALEMEIAQSGVQVLNNLDQVIPVSSISLANDDTHFLTINLANPLTPQQLVSIRISFTGKYAEDMFGAYVSRYEENGQEVRLVTSQLQPTHARRVFPCFDEPNFKARFRTTIYAPPAYTVVRTNMPTRQNPDKPVVEGWSKHEFQDSEIMSTYLHGFLVSKFEQVNNNVNGIYRLPFTVFSRPGTQINAAFALDFGQKSMVELEKYYELPFALPKLDKVAVPDFAAGAMENWGIVIYREVALLVADGVTTTATKQNVGRIITHENIHFWFGNEVSPMSWNYLWLSEGFASFFEYYGTDLVLPGWRMNDQFLLIMQNVFHADAILSVNPMTAPVYSPSEVIGTFNSVAYQKSASVIRMLQNALTPSVFQAGIRKYLSAMSRQAAEPTNLYQHLQSALDESQVSLPYPVATIMERWVNQGGFPVLTITRSANTANSIVVTQERYLADNSLTSNDRWHVPINWVLSSSPNFEDTRPLSWIPAVSSAVAVDIPQLSEAEWYIINKKQTGYYRVNYDEANWVKLSKVMNDNHEIIHLLNRANLLDDAFNLARNGRLNYAHAFGMSLYLVKEKDYIPWGAVNPSFNYLDVVLGGSKAYPAFQKYLLALSAPLYQELSFDVKQGEQHVAAFHRNLILELNCRHGNSDCNNKALALLENFKNDASKTINPDIQNLVYCSSLRGGSVENFQFLWDMYTKSSDSSQQSVLLNALGCTSNTDRLNFYLNQVIDANSQVRDQDRHTIIVSVINSSPQGMELALNFVYEHFAVIQQRVQGLTGTPNILNALARRLTSQAHADRIQQLVDRHSAILTAGELNAIAAIRENIAASISWSNRNLATVEAWLNENYGSDGEGGGAAAITSSLVILISVVVTIFNH